MRLAGVPASVAVPFPLLVKVTPDGSVPVDWSAGTGKPVVVTEKLLAAPTENVTALALVIAGGWLTVRTKFCVTGGCPPAVAVKVSGKLPDAVAVPASVAVPLPWFVNVTPAGRAPLTASDALGMVWTVKVPAWP